MRHTRTVAFHTLGCKLNLSETGTLARSLEEAGYARVRAEDRPDVFVLNTCSVTENADRECRRHVRRFNAINPEGFIAVVGCYAQLKPEEIAAIPGVDLVLGANEKFELAEYIERCHSGLDPESREGDGARFRVKPGVTKPGGRALYGAIKEVRRFIPSWTASERTRAFLKVQDGCDYFCSFCTIPLARGRSRSGTIAETAAQAEATAATGVKEIVLTGVNIGDFGRNGSADETFLRLIEALDRIEGIDRFRISSIEPNLCSDAIIGLVADSRRFVPHFHIPLQSGSDTILRRMRRRYDTALYAERVHRIKELMPHACIGTDVITGTPGETEEEFLRTHEFLRSIPVDYLHVFTYSERTNTTAVRMEDVVPMEVRRERTKRLRILSGKLQRAFYERHLGAIRPVLFEVGEIPAESGTSAGSAARDPAVNGIPAGSPRTSGDPAEVSSRVADPAEVMEGYTDNYIRVSLPYDAALLNTIVPVTLERINGDGHAEGRVIAPMSGRGANWPTCPSGRRAANLQLAN